MRLRKLAICCVTSFGKGRVGAKESTKGAKRLAASVQISMEEAEYNTSEFWKYWKIPLAQGAAEARGLGGGSALPPFVALALPFELQGDGQV